MKMYQEFKQFAIRGNVVDMAVGVILGGAFGKIVSSLVTDVIMPPIGLLLRGVDFTSLKMTMKDSLRQWKLSEVDLQAQEQWDKFTNQKYGMLRKTHTSSAPWTVIRSNDKHQARLNAMRVILNAVPYKRLNKDLDFVPDSDIVISGAREVELMEAERIKAGKFSQ